MCLHRVAGMMDQQGKSASERCNGATTGVASLMRRKEEEMMSQESTYMSTANWQIVDGMTVYATDGTKLGTLRNYNPQAGFLDIQKGWLFTKDFYVPAGMVDTVAEDGITLKLTKDDLNDPRYSSPMVNAGSS
jgi:hypothetical protein